MNLLTASYGPRSIIREGASSSATITASISSGIVRDGWKDIHTGLLVKRGLLRVGRIASHHLIGLVDGHTHSLDDVEVSEAGDNLVLHSELDSQPVFRTPLDDEWSLRQLFDSTGGVEVDDDGSSIGDEEGKFEDDDL